MDQREATIEAIARLLGPLLTALETLAFVARNLHPPHLDQLVAAVADRGPPVEAALDIFLSNTMPPEMTDVGALLEQASRATIRAYGELMAAPSQPEAVFQVYRALRHIARANEDLYPLAGMLPPVSSYFLEPSMRANPVVRARLDAVDRRRANVGVMHAKNARGERGGFSVYVPEYLDPELPAPLVMALHGGSGHGREFLWYWLRDARARGAIVISPTSAGGTWSLTEPERDSARLIEILDQVRSVWPVDEERILLTGMSDGGTFSYLAGLSPEAPYTHVAPISASFHPMLLGFLDGARVRSTPLTIVHGALDWMFPIMMARDAQRSFAEVGADVRYHEIADLSHTYPREENAVLLDWLTAPLPA